MTVVTSFFRRLARDWARFMRARDGNIAIIFGIALIPILAFIGAAVDYSRANAVRASMQATLDATALLLSKDIAAGKTATVQSSAETYFFAQFNRPEATNVTVTANYTNTTGSTVVVSGTANVPADFLGIIGFPTIAVAASSSTKWGSARLRVALVLDTTGSMLSDGKISALKTATKSLLDQLKAAASVPEDVYVSIVPFSKAVNLASNNYNATWIDWTDWNAEPNILNTSRGGSKPSNWDQLTGGSTCPFTNSSHGFQCTTGPTNGSSTTSSIPSSGSYDGYICPSVDSGNKSPVKNGIYYNGCYDSVATTTTVVNTICSGKSSCSCGSRSNCTCTGSGNNKSCKQTVTTTGAPYTHPWIANAHSTWNGCVTDRGSYSGPVSDYDRLVTAPDAGVTATLFPAEQYSYCSPTVMGLGYNWTAMKTQVDSLVAQGSTNQPVGLVWGWQSLVGGGPLSAPALTANYTYSNVIILLSDGLNTQDRWYGNGSNTSTQVDARMLDSNGLGTCANIKATGVIVYTIQVNTGGDPTSALLQNCASASDKFFLLTTADQIITTFNKIGSNLTQLRIAQ